MEKPRTWRNVVFSDLGLLIITALALVVLHMLTNGRYGFHRDELGLLDDARHPAWGYVTYPPLTPFLARVALGLFGTSLVGFRLFGTLAQGAVVVLAGLMARELGGSRKVQIAAALATAVAPVALYFGSVLMHSSLDYLWWVLVAYLLIRLLKSENPRWWLGLGAAVGLGMMTKYSMGFLVAAILGGLLLTKARRQLASPWLWGGVAVALLIFLPNLLWQVRHHFIGLEYLGSIHARDIGEGRAEGFLIEQFLLCAATLTIPIWLAGLYYYFFTPAGRRYRPLGWIYVITFVFFLVTRGRAYYLAPAYPMLLAAGAVQGGRWLAALRSGPARLVRGAAWGAIVLSAMLIGALSFRLAAVGSPWWDVVIAINGEYKEEIGWPELAETVADVYDALPTGEKPRAGILVGNYGEIGALDVYGPAHGLPDAVSGINSCWLRGYGDPPPETVIAVGFPLEYLRRNFDRVELAARVTNRFGVKNEESTDYPGIVVCRGLRVPWRELWKQMLHFG